MAHFAQLDHNNIVIQVIVINNESIINENGIEEEALGLALCHQLYGSDTIWKQTSYNHNFRKNYAGIGFTYDSQNDAFVAPQPFPSWVLDDQTQRWNPPVPYPDYSFKYDWDEENITWKKIE
jgi:hypothetical protein